MIRLAKTKDISKISALLQQVLAVHAKGRPDLFKENTQKYSEVELQEILKDKNRPVFVFVDERDTVLGYAFCEIKTVQSKAVLREHKQLYIDDLCVDESKRGMQIGSKLYQYVEQYAKEISCDYVTLNVWDCNKDAISFYYKMGLTPQKTTMEKKL